MDAEPGRCRRTDGKKWRCKLAVLPNQKYCERHVHRGRARSRKLVEVKTPLLKSKSTTTPNLKSDAKTINAINHNKVGIKNESFKIMKQSRDKAGGPPEFKLLAESVIQHGNGQCCGITSNDKTGALVLTDSKECNGKKWQFSKEEQKYRVEQIHGEAKNFENGQKSNTGLSFLVGASYGSQQINNDGIQSVDVSSSSSEATTISM